MDQFTFGSCPATIPLAQTWDNLKRHQRRSISKSLFRVFTALKYLKKGLVHNQSMQDIIELSKQERLKCAKIIPISQELLAHIEEIIKFEYYKLERDYPSRMKY